MKKQIAAILLPFSFLALIGCSATSKPTFYPNDVFLKAGPAQVDADREYCMSLADEYVKDPDKYTEAAKEGAIGAGVGAGAGAIGGVIMQGSVGRATAAGAAVGGIMGVVSSMRKQGDRSPSYQRFVEHCLHKKGYEITGWQ